jgi:hypothetical protein
VEVELLECVLEAPEESVKEPQIFILKSADVGIRDCGSGGRSLSVRGGLDPASGSELCNGLRAGNRLE